MAQKYSFVSSAPFGDGKSRTVAPNGDDVRISIKHDVCMGTGDSRRLPPTMVLENDQFRKRSGASQVSTNHIERDPTHHHLTRPLLPQTPLGSLTPAPADPPATVNGFRSSQLPAPHWWLQWATDPSVSLKFIIVPVTLSSIWHLASPHIASCLPNPFARVFLLSGYLEGSKPDDPRYAKSYCDLLFLVYYIVFFSFVRQSIALKISRPLAHYFGLKKESKLVRFGEQFYALVYFSFFGAWGHRVMSQLPSYWYKTDQFWVEYPHRDLQPELKRYYLMQFAYWCQQVIVLILGLEKPRKDHRELVAHHFVTLWLIGWSYLLNYTVIGSAVFMSMDIPDAFFAASKLLNYIQWERAKMVSFAIFICVWTYFRHYLNIKIMWSVLFESTTIAQRSSQVWDWMTGGFMIWWMPPAIFVSLCGLQLLNLFWYYLIWRVLIRAVLTRTADDDRSDDDGDDEPTNNAKGS